jgi:hypothetical protein
METSNFDKITKENTIKILGKIEGHKNTTLVNLGPLYQNSYEVLRRVKFF